MNHASIGARGTRRGFLALSLSAALVVGWAVAAGADLLSVTATDVTFPTVTLNGSDQTTTASVTSVWTIVDLRLTGAPWTVSISATNPTSAAGTVETTPRTIPAADMVVTAGTITATIGSDPVTNITGQTDLVLSTSPQTFVSSTGNSTGTYTFLPSYSLTVPANAYRSNYSGTVGASSLNPYTSTITVTIA